KLIVRSAEQPNVGNRRLASSSQRQHVVELEPPTRAATSAVLGDECALAVISLPYRPPDLSRNGSAGSWSLVEPTRTVGVAALPHFQLGDEKIERAGEHLVHVPGWEDVGQKILGTTDLLMGLPPEPGFEREPRDQRYDLSGHHVILNTP